MQRQIVCWFGLLLLILTLCLTMASCDIGIASFETDVSSSDNKQDFPLETEASTSMDIQIPDHDHIYELRVLVPPSCSVEGIQAYVCVICGKQQHITNIAVLPHNYQRSDTLSSRPTCTTDGKEVYRCRNCGCSQAEVQEAKGHSWHTKVTCDSNTNELIVSPHCTRCSSDSTYGYRYKINDVKELIDKNGQFADYGGSASLNGSVVEYYQKAPYYRVYCTGTYLLIVRNTEPIAWYSEFGAIGGAAGFYTSRGCTIVLEANISITADGHIQILQ